MEATKTRVRPEVADANLISKKSGFSPAKAWAIVGAGCTAMWVYLWVRWIASGDLAPIPSGPTPIPHRERVAAHAMEATMLVLLAIIVWALVIRPWRRNGRISFDGLLFFGMMSLFWQDMLGNYVRPYFLFSLGFFQWRSWAEYLPGIRLPNAQMFPEPVLFEWSGYGVAFLGGALLGGAIMRTAKRRWPQLGPVRLVLITFAVLIPVDLAMELFWLRMRLYSYPAMWGPALFRSRTFQFPIFQTLLWSACWTAFAALRYFRNDRGETVAERGLSAVSERPRTRAVVRYLALTGILNVIFFGYNLGCIFYTMQSGAWPRDVTDRSYLLDRQCGPGTKYACPEGPVQVFDRLGPEIGRG